MQKAKKHKDVWVFTEIQDHERVFEGSLELLSRGRELADSLGEKLIAVVFALDAESYLPKVKKYGPDKIIYASSPLLKHYSDHICPDMMAALIAEHAPSILLIPATEAGRDLAPRIAHRFATGLTAHCTGLEIISSDEYGEDLLLMKRPGFSGNMLASIICPHTRPQIATIQPGAFQKTERPHPAGNECETMKVEFTEKAHHPDVTELEAPTRWDRKDVPLESAPVVIAGGRGLENSQVFSHLHKLAELLNAGVGATRVPVFNGWCGEERMIGQTGKRISPGLYIGFGVSGQIQHTTSIIDSECIVSVNIDPNAPLHKISDYIIIEDAPRFLDLLMTTLTTTAKKEERQDQSDKRVTPSR